MKRLEVGEARGRPKSFEEKHACGRYGATVEGANVSTSGVAKGVRVTGTGATTFDHCHIFAGGDLITVDNT
jgi:hypothetical protein